ncbi:MAG: 16S rRNA (cytosine(1402)-N(4))-methyltransferase, partial [Candidatus Woesebacteria bacterium]|nr:16S rRNA (cytosine(1402)-N(4))-methyltransferase [Candidatus Woesebacteria bacterium]
MKNNPACVDRYHEPVMVKEVLESLHINISSQTIDATLGTGGHAEAIINKGGKVLGIEADPKMLAIAKVRLPKANFVLGNFINIDKIAKENNFDKVTG